MATVTTRRATGCIFDTPHRKRLYAPAVGPRGFMASSPTLQLGTTSLAEYEATVLDQGETGSCEGHASAMAAWMDFAASGSPLPWFPSPDGIYRDARCNARSPVGGTLPALTDSGAMTSDVMLVFQSCGLRKMQGPAPDGRNSDVDPSTVNNEPRLDQLDAEAGSTILVDPGAYAIDLTDTQAAIAVIQAALDAKHPVRLDIICDSIFQQWFRSPGAPIDDCNPNDPTAGGHAIQCGELQSTASGVVLCGLNSWGALGSGSLVAGPNPSGHWQGTGNWFAKAVQGAYVWACKRA